MLIDWFTVGAQLLNFLILVWLLERFLYRPVLSAIDVREKRIATELQDADRSKADAQKDREAYELKSKEFDQQRETLLNQATVAAHVERERLVESARKDAEALRHKLHDAAVDQRDDLNREIVVRVRQEVFAIARKALFDLAGANLEERLVDAFVRRLREMDNGPRKQLAISLRTSSGPAFVQSAFVLQPPQCLAIESAINDVFATSARLEFGTNPDLVCGIELTADGYKFAWSISEYLAALSKSVSTLLEAKTGTEASGAAIPKVQDAPVSVVKKAA